MKLGLGDYSILFAMAGCIVSTVVCVVYGVVNWNGNKYSVARKDAIVNKDEDQK